MGGLSPPIKKSLHQYHYPLIEHVMTETVRVISK